MVLAARNLSLEQKRYNSLVVSHSTHKRKAYKKKIPDFSQQRIISYYTLSEVTAVLPALGVSS